MVGRIRTIRELIVCVCDFFQVNPTPQTLTAWASKLHGINPDQLQDLANKITDSWERWDQYGNFPKRVWATFYALPKHVEQEQGEIINPVPKEKVQAWIRDFCRNMGNEKGN